MLKYFWQSRSGVWHLILILSLLQIAITFLTYHSLLSFDEAIWQYIGRNWFRHGLVPYAGGVDNKLPLIFAVYGFSDLLFGLNFWFPRILAIVCQSVGIYFVFRIAKHVAGTQGGMIAVILYGLSLMWRTTDGKWVSSTQTYEITFLIISIYLLLTAQQRRRFFIGGCMAGIALAFKFTAGFTILAILISIIQRRTIKSAMVFLSGVLTSLFSFVILFLLLGIKLPDMIFYAFFDNFTPGSITDHPLNWKIEQFANAFFYSELILFYPFIIAYFIIKPKKQSILLLWLIGSFISVAIIGIYARSHLKELLPSLSVMSAIAIHHAITRYNIPLRPIILIIAITFFPKTFEPLVGLKRVLFGTNIKKEFCREPFTEDEDSKRSLGLWIRSNTRPNDLVFVAGFGAQIQAYSCRLSPSIYFNVTQTPLAKKRLFSDLSQNKPALIIVPLFQSYAKGVDADIRQYVSDVIAADYSLERCLYSYNIYRRR